MTFEYSKVIRRPFRSTMVFMACYPALQKYKQLINSKSSAKNLSPLFRRKCLQNCCSSSDRRHCDNKNRMCTVLGHSSSTNNFLLCQIWMPKYRRRYFNRLCSHRLLVIISPFRHSAIKVALTSDVLQQLDAFLVCAQSVMHSTAFCQSPIAAAPRTAVGRVQDLCSPAAQ